MKNICATVGILTFNSERNLARALESVKDFSEIVIADGGSTDATLEIAKRYGARIVSQSNPGHPIEDFARERNITLAAAKQKWFFHLDSDEIMSPELVQAIREIASHESPYDAYRVRYQKTNEDGTHPYRTFKEYYQIRLVRTDIGARYIHTAHEILQFDGEANIGQVEAPWYVPLEREDLMLVPFCRKAWKRTAGTLDSWQPKGIGNVFSKVVLGPTALLGKSLFKAFMVKVRYGRDAIPLRYELLRVVYAGMLFVQALRRVLQVGIR
jgi:glycosyltransferase involved in cell wall biosynthesis